MLELARREIEANRSRAQLSESNGPASRAAAEFQDIFIHYLTKYVQFRLRDAPQSSGHSLLSRKRGSVPLIVAIAARLPHSPVLARMCRESDVRMLVVRTGMIVHGCSLQENISDYELAPITASARR